MGRGASKVERNKRSCFFFLFFFSKNKKKKAVGGDFFIEVAVPQTPDFPGGPNRRGLVTRGCPPHPTPPVPARRVVVLR